MRFACADPASWPAPAAALTTSNARYGTGTAQGQSPRAGATLPGDQEGRLTVVKLQAPSEGISGEADGERGQIVGEACCAAGFFYGLLSGETPDDALKLGWAHGALLTTFPGDTTMATADQVRALATGGSARIQR